MIKKIILSALFVVTSNFAIASIPCDSSLQRTVALIQELPAGKQLLENVQKEGPVRIIARPADLANQFGAYWDPDSRIIVINASNVKHQDKVIQSIVFECHNVLITKKLNELASLAVQGRISKADYVRAVEFLEFCNSHSASKLVDEGIRQGIFPQSAHLPIYPTFEEHFRVQQMAGHSQWIARTYDSLRQSYMPY